MLNGRTTGRARPHFADMARESSERKQDASYNELRAHGGKLMDAFLEAFFSVDVDNHEVISLEDLKNYNKQHSLEDSFPDTFMKLFHGDETGSITLEQYCKTLGLVPKHARDMRRRRTTQMLDNLIPSDLEIVHDDMDLEIKVKVIQMLVDELRESGRKPNLDVDRLDEAVKKLKSYLMERYGKPWHIVISCNQQLAWFSYVPGYMFHFCLGRFAVLIWKTPAA